MPPPVSQADLDRWAQSCHQIQQIAATARRLCGWVNKGEVATLLCFLEASAAGMQRDMIEAGAAPPVEAASAVDTP